MSGGGVGRGDGGGAATAGRWWRGGGGGAVAAGRWRRGSGGAAAERRQREGVLGEAAAEGLTAGRQRRLGGGGVGAAWGRLGGGLGAAGRRPREATPQPFWRAPTVKRSGPRHRVLSAVLAFIRKMCLLCYYFLLFLHNKVQ